jgi:hypothetical protein
MATPRIYWYPDPDGALKTIDFKEGLTDIQEFDDPDVVDAANGDETNTRTFRAIGRRVRIVLERFGPIAGGLLERDLVSLRSHLVKGGYIGFTRDHAKAWCGIRQGAATQGDTLFQTAGNGFTAWSPSGTLTSGDDVVIESPTPEAQQEVSTCSAINASGDVTLATALRYSYDGKVIARWRDFYPVCWLPQDQVRRPFLTHDRRLNYTLDLTLAYSVADVVSLWDSNYATDYQSGVSLRTGSGRGPLYGALALRDGDALVGSYGHTIETLLGTRASASAASSGRRIS